MMKTPPRLSAMRNTAGLFFRKEGIKMAYYEGSYLVMSEDGINALIERCQQPEAIQRRDAFFAELDQMPIRYNQYGSIKAEFTPNSIRRW